MEIDERRLDGNALGGLFGEIFGREMTNARGQCAACGAIEPLGAAHVYAAPLAPGAVVRCCHCQSVLMVVVRDGKQRLGCPGMAWIELSDAGDAG